MNRIIFSIIIVFTVSINLVAQKSEIKVFPQDKNLFTGSKIINRLVSNGVEILNIETNFGPESHVMGFFIDPVKYMGIEQGMILSTGVVDNVDQSSTQEDYSSMELVEDEDIDFINVSSQDSQIINAIPDSLNSQNCSITHVINGQIFTEYVGQSKVKSEDTDLSKKIKDIKTLHQSNIKSGDSDLSKEIKGIKTFDARILEIDFIPTADSIYYRYVFASEEYDEYVCSPFNDIFAFFLSKQGGKKKNVALVPNQDLPVSINTINNGNPFNSNCEKVNPHLYEKNNGCQNLLFDGFTKVLDIREKVAPGEKYSLKISIADASDGIYDSAVLLENGSIFSYYESYEIQFENNSSKTDDDKTLKCILSSMKKHPASNIQLIGHTDQTGSTSYNFDLSIERVEEIKNYLMSKGIEEDRIIAAYKGETMPRYKNDDKNRRVEIFILGE